MTDPVVNAAPYERVPSRAEPALIEIVERVTMPEGESFSDEAAATDAMGGYIKPSEVRINGVPLAIPRGQQIKVHKVVLNADPDPRAEDVLQVTLTVFARRVVMGAEPA